MTNEQVSQKPIPVGNAVEHAGTSRLTEGRAATKPVIRVGLRIDRASGLIVGWRFEIAPVRARHR